MRLKLLLVVLMMYLILPSGSAKGNISIEEIGTEPEELIDGTNAWFFANLNNSGDQQVEIVLEFWLDSASVSRKKVILEPRTYKRQIKSDNSSSVSPGNKMIEVAVYVENTKVDSMSAQITVNKRESPPEQEKNNFVFGYSLIAGAIATGIYLFIRNRKTVGEERTEIGKAENSAQEIAKQAIPAANRDGLSNNFAFFLKDLKNRPEGYGQGEEYKLLVDIIENIYNMMQNMEKSNTEGAKWSLENVKRGTNSLLSRFKKEKVQMGTTLHAKVEISPHADIHKAETYDKNEIMAELEKKRAETNHKKQFVDVLIPEFLLKIAEEKIRDGDSKGSKSLILAAEMMLKNDEVLQRLRKLREIGF